MNPSRKEQLLYLLVGLLFLWFIVSSAVIGFYWPTLHDDAMFASIPKNFLNGYGWATSYGEKMLFNPDISTGPTLLLPAMALMKVFGNASWVPAVTSLLMNVSLCLLIVWQLRNWKGNQAAYLFALLLAISLFRVDDFRTFIAYYTTSLLFVFALLFVFDGRFPRFWRLAAYGSMASIGLYAKPLIFMSFLCGFPLVAMALSDRKDFFVSFVKMLSIMLIACLITLTPWHIFKNASLSKQSDEVQQAYTEYHKQFFEYHGTGIGQFKDARDKVLHLKRNLKKNYRIFNKYLKTDYSVPFSLFAGVLLLCVVVSAKKVWKRPDDKQAIFLLIFSLITVVNTMWFVLMSFAMTAGHTFYAVLFMLLLVFFFLGSCMKESLIAIILMILVAASFTSRHGPAYNAYSFTYRNTFLGMDQFQKAVDFYLSNPDFPYPVASCGYTAAPRRLEYLLPESENFADCYNLLEDNLVLDEEHYRQHNRFFLKQAPQEMSPLSHFFTSGKHHKVQAKFHWKEPVDFVLYVEGPGYFGALPSQGYVLGLLADVCLKNVLFRTEHLAFCTIKWNDIKEGLDPTETARALVDYQSWYRTRFRVY